MSAIKPPSGPGATTPTAPTEANRTAERTSRPSFADEVATNRTASTAAPGAMADPTQHILAELRAGRVDPTLAVQQLCDLAVKRAGVPEALRPAVESRVREMLATDPLVGSLIRRMGASPTSES